MFLHHYGSLILGSILIVSSIIAGYWVCQSPRRYGRPRWPLLTLFGGVGLRGLACYLLSIHRPAASTIVELISTGVLWVAVGAVLTQWCHESIQDGRPARR